MHLNHLQVAEHDLQRWFAKNCVGFRLITSVCKVSTLSQGTSSTSPANLLGLTDRQQGDQQRLRGAAATRILLLAVRRLPPITTRWTPNMGDDAFLNRGFTFQCPAWRTCALQEVLLTKVHSSPRCLPHKGAFLRAHKGAFLPAAPVGTLRPLAYVQASGREGTLAAHRFCCCSLLEGPHRGAGSLYLTRLSRTVLKRLVVVSFLDQIGREVWHSASQFAEDGCWDRQQLPCCAVARCGDRRTRPSSASWTMCATGAAETVPSRSSCATADGHCPRSRVTADCSTHQPLFSVRIV